MNQEIIRPWVELTLRETAAKPVIQMHVANYALAALAETQLVNYAARGSLPAVITRVDGRLAAATLIALAAVKLARGIIEFRFEDTDDILRWIMGTLRDVSPFREGDYQTSHILLADGTEVNLDNGRSIPGASEYVFVSLAPYARKIERGESSQAPDGVYQATAALARRRFPDRQVFITFEYSQMADRARRDRSSISHDHWLKRQPAIIVRVR